MKYRLAGVVVLFLALVACASSQPKKSFEMSIGDNSATFDLSREVVLAMLEDGLNTTLECDGEVDGDLVELLEPLQRKRYSTTSRGRGEDRVVASRRGSRLTIVIGDTKSGHLRATVPWAVGECLLGRKTTFDKALGSDPIKVELTTEGGTKVSASLTSS